MKKLRSAQTLIGLVGLLSFLPIYIGGFMIWQMSDVPTRADTDNGLERLEEKIGETYTSEMHQKFSKIVKDGDEAVFIIFDTMKNGGRWMLVFGLVLFGSSFTSALFIKKALSVNGLAEKPEIAPLRQPSD